MASMGKLLIAAMLAYAITFTFSIDSVGGMAQDASSTLDTANSSFSESLNTTVNATANETDGLGQIDASLAGLNLTAPEENDLEAELRANREAIEGSIRATQTAEQVTASRLASQLNAFATIIGTSVVAIALMIVVPLLFSMYLKYRQDSRMNSKGASTSPVVINQLYRVLVAIGVIFVVVLIVVYLNSLVWFNTIQGRTEILTALLETQKNFTTIIGTAFASLVAFYFGTRATQNKNPERTTTLTSPGTIQKTLEIIDVNPVDGTVGVDVDSPVTTTFSASVRSSTINTNSFSVKDASGNPVQGKITLADSNTTVRFDPVPSFNRNSRYTVSVTKGIIDISGLPLAADKEWHFITTA